jgi:hypothetical protein
MGSILGGVDSRPPPSTTGASQGASGDRAGSAAASAIGAVFGAVTLFTIVVSR